jgi:hypothetical protein
MEIAEKETRFNLGDFVYSKKTHDIAIIDRRGYFPGVYRVVPKIDGEHWISEDQIEILP